MSTSAIIHLHIEDESLGEYHASFHSTHDGFPEAILDDFAPDLRKRLDTGRPLDALNYISTHFDHHEPTPYSRANANQYDFRWSDGEWTAEQRD